MRDYYEQVEAAAGARCERGSARVPDVAIVLGSGLGDFADAADATRCRRRTARSRTGRRRR